MSLSAGTRGRRGRRTGRPVASVQYTSGDDEERRETIEILIRSIELLRQYHQALIDRIIELYGMEFVGEIDEFTMNLVVEIEDDIKRLEEHMGQQYFPTEELSELGFELKERDSAFIITYYKNSLAFHFPQISHFLI